MKYLLKVGLKKVKCYVMDFFFFCMFDLNLELIYLNLELSL